AFSPEVKPIWCVMLNIGQHVFSSRPCRQLSGGKIMQPFEFPKEFRTREIATNGTTIHVRSGGSSSGSAVALLHGYGETGDMWAPLAFDLMRDHTVVVPDLRGMGLSAKPP